MINANSNHTGKTFKVHLPSMNNPSGFNGLTIDFANDSRQDIANILRQNKGRQLFEANQAARERQREANRNNRRPHNGSVSLSNADTIARANAIRGRLQSKIAEVAASDMPPRARDALMADIQLQIDRVDQKISAIRRREQAMLAEQTARRNEDERTRRRRREAMHERRINIREDLLYHANQGGLDPNANGMNQGGFGLSAGAPVSLDVGGMTGTVDASIASVSAMPSVEITL